MHVKHVHEDLQKERQQAQKEALLRAKREAVLAGNFEAYSLATPATTPNKSADTAGTVSNPTVSTFPGASTTWSTFGPGVVPMNLGNTFEQVETKPLNSAFVQGPNLTTVPENKTPGSGSNTGLPEVLAELKALREQQVTKADLANLRQDMLQSTAELLDTKLAPLQQELEDLKRKQGLLEAKHKALEAEVKDLKKKQGNTPPTTSTTLPFLPPALDPATKRAAFVGWPDTVAADDRLQQMEALLTSTFPDFKPLTYLNDYKGPYNNRKLGSVSYVEFGNQDTARNFVKAVEERGVTVQSKEKQLLVKQAQTQKQKARNWALRKAEELVKGKPEATGVKLEWKKRKVIAEGEDAFTQERA